MTDRQKQACERFGITEEVQERMGEVVRGAFRLLADEVSRAPEQKAEFDRRFEEARGRIARGARRTDGRLNRPTVPRP
ncbi:MAG TPA: hypothetical protein VGN26_04005 [Armatimonadota bacterium]|jgi:hypothetical protein